MWKMTGKVCWGYRKGLFGGGLGVEENQCGKRSVGDTGKVCWIGLSGGVGGGGTSVKDDGKGLSGGADGHVDKELCVVVINNVHTILTDRLPSTHLLQITCLYRTMSSILLYYIQPGAHSCFRLHHPGKLRWWHAGELLWSHAYSREHWGLILKG